MSKAVAFPCRPERLLSETLEQNTSQRTSTFLEKMGVFYQRRGNIQILSRHKILDDIATDLLAGLSVEFNPARRITIFCGIHKFFGPDVFRRGYKIGIQTEHFYDEGGKFIARRSWEIPQVLRFVRRCRAILDLNPANWPMYENLPAREKSKITFGPHIFPPVPPKFCPSIDDRAVFFGTSSGRRSRILESLDPQRFQRLKSSKFGAGLIAELSKFGAVLNIHHDEGIYTEAPRILIALKAGKPLVSEALSSEWKPGIHYLLPADFAPDANLEEVFDAMSDQCTRLYSFQRYLEASLPK